MSDAYHSVVSIEALHETAVAPEIRLFRHIILNAVLDAIHGSYVRNENNRVKSAAFDWFAEAGQDFELICDCAGLHPGSVRQHALRYILNARAGAQPPARPRLHQAAPPRKEAA